MSSIDSWAESDSSKLVDVFRQDLGNVFQCDWPISGSRVHQHQPFHHVSQFSNVSLAMHSHLNA